MFYRLLDKLCWHYHRILSPLIQETSSVVLNLKEPQIFSTILVIATRKGIV